MWNIIAVILCSDPYLTRRCASTGRDVTELFTHSIFCAVALDENRSWELIECGVAERETGSPCATPHHGVPLVAPLRCGRFTGCHPYTWAAQNALWSGSGDLFWRWFFDLQFCDSAYQIQSNLKRNFWYLLWGAFINKIALMLLIVPKGYMAPLTMSICNKTIDSTELVVVTVNYTVNTIGEQTYWSIVYKVDGYFF